jgi:3-hydroxyacyl-CoA dehydrogenase/enoyl-CoA hydratase/3-hydroxybutyryl-CoA epimerase
MKDTEATETTMQTLRTTTDADGVLTIWIDVPDKSVNTVSPAVLAELSEVFSGVEHNPPRGVVIASAKRRGFVAGADLFEIRRMEPAQVEQFLADGQALFDHLERLPVPAVAAINGDCLGGGLELALACDYRVAVDDGSVNIGLPEVKLGILPAWGGTVRLPRTIGLRRALPLLLAGKTMPPRKAMKAGIVDEVVRPEALQSAAKRLVMSHGDRHRAPRVDRAIAAVASARKRVFAAAAAQTLQLTRGNYPAPMKLIDVVRTGYDRGPAAGLEAERAALLELMDTDACRNLLRLFFLRQGAKKWITSAITTPPRPVKHAAVIGGGTMGAGIVHALVRAGIPTRLIEVNPAAAAAGLARVRKMLEEDVGTGRMTALDAHHTFNRVAPSTDWTGLRLCDVVVEAVVEEMDAKRDVFRKLDGLTRADAVLATNTSSLSVTRLAESTAHPNRVVGLHFFNPVPKMPLVEVIRGPQSDDVSLATAAALAGRIGKTPILVRDGPGFLVNRVLIPYLAEALQMAAEGEPIERIDAAMKDWGMPMGPFELLDEIGLDIGLHVLESFNVQTGANRPVPAAVAQAVERGWRGRKSDRGFYVHSDGPAKGKSKSLEVNAELAAMLTAPGRPPGAPVDRAEPGWSTDAQWRLVLPMVNEAARLLDEGVTDSTDAVDLATVLGLGFAPFRGGLARFADTVGMERVVNMLSALAAEHGPRFEPAPLLRRLADSHRMMNEFALLRDGGAGGHTANEERHHADLHTP